ncbi:hypothetical protein FQN57_002149 [Myotisia sp. PD_48]|nr:hypothetical protein FQN57_002149 [Myotisia sp. PD_48]
MEDGDRLPAELELLIIRFSASVPDIFLEIPNPTTTNAARLKQLIRSSLPRKLTSRRLRLIHAGKALEDDLPLAKQIRTGSNNPQQTYQDYHGRNSSHSEPPALSTTSSLPPSLTSNSTLSSPPSNKLDPSWKGKAPIRDISSLGIYIHCSIGDVTLTSTELDNEAHIASLLPRDQHEDSSGSLLGADDLDGAAGPANRTVAERRDGSMRSNVTDLANTVTSTTPTPTPPRGFDRLLSSGFTPSEVSSLRSQFLALLSISHTPDTLPSGAELRRLEDRWMDEGSSEGGGVGTNQGSGIFGDSNVDDGSGGALDDMLWGSVMGFFWPVGCGLWLLREEGIWSWRKGLAVFVGVVVNFGFGAVRLLG